MIVGLTGGIGSGKTTVAKFFYELGVPIYIADLEAKKLMLINTELKEKIIGLLGDEAYLDNELNRSYISNKVFNNKELLQELNSLVHPAVAKDFELWYKKQETAYVIKESAILFESGSYKNCDIIITVTAPLEERISRVVIRDNISKENVKARIKNQMSDDDKIAQSDFVINNFDLEDTRCQVDRINTTILNKIRKNRQF